MIITRTPFRITFGGGGTDLPSYYNKYGGFVFSAAIDKYMFVNVNRPIVDDLIRVKYTKSETVTHIDDVQHVIARECMRLVGFENAVEISSMADVPAGTGLGSSSCYAVGLLHALHILKRDFVSLEQLAREACNIEMDILGQPVGKQDQYMGAYGGLTVMDIGRDGTVAVRPASVALDVMDALNKNILMFYTGISRDANSILKEQSVGATEENARVIDSMHYIKELGYKILEAVESGNITKVGHYFDEHWEYKKRISQKMTNPHFDKIYTAAKENGALGGKISGAGGGGFFVFYIEEKQQQFRTAMRSLGLREMRYRFDLEGTRSLMNY